MSYNYAPEGEGTRLVSCLSMMLWSLEISPIFLHNSGGEWLFDGINRSLQVKTDSINNHD